MAELPRRSNSRAAAIERSRERVAQLSVGDRVIVEYAGSEPATAIVMDLGESHRPHVIKVKYEHSRTAAWVLGDRVTVAPDV